jgi:hypothetical protein
MSQVSHAPPLVLVFKIADLFTGVITLGATGHLAALAIPPVERQLLNGGRAGIECAAGARDDPCLAAGQSCEICGRRENDILTFRPYPRATPLSVKLNFCVPTPILADADII